MKKLALAPIGIFFGLAVAACSLVVNADRSKVGDDLYHPTDAGVADASDASDASDAADSGDTESAAGASGAAGSGDEAGAAGMAGATGG